MRILYLSQYFIPEVGATQIRAYEMASNWVRLGHEVTMICEVPNHPSGIIPPQYRRIFFQRDQLDGIKLIRVWVKASPTKNFASRMLFYLTYMVNATIAGVLLAREKYDLIYASSPPLFVGGAALALKFIKRIPMVFEVRDLWPESAIALGELSGSLAIRGATFLEEACYKKAEKIIVVTQGSRRRLIERGFPENKIEVVPNGANVDVFKYKPADRQTLRKEYGLEGKFVALYAGIHGIAQGLETIVQAAEILREDTDIQFLFIGEGPVKAELTSMAARMNISNITLLSEKPTNVIPSFISAADVALIPLRKIDLFKDTLPSKLFDSWACQRPVLLCVDGEARQIIDQAQAGVYVPPEDPHALAQALIDLKNNPKAVERMGRNGRDFTERYYSRRKQAIQLAELLETMIS